MSSILSLSFKTLPYHLGPFLTTWALKRLSLVGLHRVIVTERKMLFKVQTNYNHFCSHYQLSRMGCKINIPGEGIGNPLQYSCLEKSHGRRSLVGYSPWGRKESDTTERLHFHFVDISLQTAAPNERCELRQTNRKTVWGTELAFGFCPPIPVIRNTHYPQNTGPS